MTRAKGRLVTYLPCLLTYAPAHLPIHLRTYAPTYAPAHSPTYAPTYAPTSQFLVGWISALDSVPDIDLLSHLPVFFDGLFHMLADPNKEIRQQACDLTMCKASHVGL